MISQAFEKVKRDRMSCKVDTHDCSQVRQSAGEARENVLHNELLNLGTNVWMTQHEMVERGDHAQSTKFLRRVSVTDVTPSVSCKSD